MSASAPTADSSSPPRSHPPMGELFALLRSSGFLATTDDYADLLKIIEVYGHEGLDSLAQRICPIIAMSPEEQDRFYQVFEGYKATQKVAPPPSLSQPPPPTRWWIWGLLLLLAAGVVVWALWPPKATTLPRSAGATLALGQPFTDSLTAESFPERTAKELEEVSGVWEDIGRGPMDSGRGVHHFFREPGLHRIRRTVHSPHFVITNPTDTISVRVCAYLPRITISTPQADPLLVGVSQRFSATADTVSPALQGFRWEVEGVDSVFSTGLDTPFVYSFDTPGVYTLYCTPSLATADSICSEAVHTSVAVADTTEMYSLSFTGSTEPFQPKTELEMWPGLLALLLSASTLYWALRKKKKVPPPPQALPPPTDAPPFEVPFESVKPDDVFIDKPLRRFLQQLRLKADETVTVLDIPASIRATVRNWGQAAAVLAPRRRIQDYLLFIDRTAPHGMLNALYVHLADVMEAEGIPVTRFYFDADFTCFNAEHPTGMSLRGIADQYAGSVPIILGDGRALLHRVAPALKPGLLHQLMRWEQCLLITPVPQNMWGRHEQLLQTHLEVVAADAVHLEKLGQRLHSGETRRAQNSAVGHSAPIRSAEPESIATLRTYVGGDEALLQWLCALSIYPKLRWELVVAIGKAVMSRYGRQADVRYDVLLRLCRIPWMAAGVISQRLRLQMLETLSVENECTARETLVALLRGVDQRYPGEYIFSSEKRLQGLLSRFVLYASDPARYAYHAGAVEELSARLATYPITDVPARKYLERTKGATYDTPLRLGSRTVGLKQFLDLREEPLTVAEFKARTARRVRRVMTVFCIVGLSAVIWGLLRFDPATRRNPALQGLYAAEPGQMVKVSYRVLRDFAGCDDTARVFSALPGTLSVDGKPYGLIFDAATQTLEASVPYDSVSKRDARYSVMVGLASRPSEIDLAALTPTGELMVRCSRYVPDIKGVPTVLPKGLNEIWSATNSQHIISINLERGMIYYSPGQVSSWRNYQIDTALKLGTNYIIVTHQNPSEKRVAVEVGSGPFQVFRMNYSGGDGFGLSVCGDEYSDIEAAMAASAECGEFDEMRLYYPKGRLFSDKIRLPVAAPSGGRARMLQSNELQKVEQYFYQFGPDSLDIKGVLPFTLVRDARYNTSHRTFDLRPQIKSYPVFKYVEKNPIEETRERLAAQSNPFAREYLEDGPTTTRFRDVTVPADSPERVNPRPPVEPSPSEQTLDSLRKALKSGDIKMSQELYDKLKKSRYPTDRAQAAYDYAEHLLKQGRPEQAEAIIRGVPKQQIQQHYYEMLDLLLSDARRQLGDEKEARSILERLTKSQYQDIRSQASQRIAALSNPEQTTPRR